MKGIERGLGHFNLLCLGKGISKDICMCIVSLSWREDLEIYILSYILLTIWQVIFKYSFSNWFWPSSWKRYLDAQIWMPAYLKFCSPRSKLPCEKLCRLTLEQPKYSTTSLSDLSASELSLPQLSCLTLQHKSQYQTPVLLHFHCVQLWLN